jgi:hypothetical protein
MVVASQTRLAVRSHKKQKDFHLTLRMLTEDCGPAKSERAARSELTGTASGPELSVNLSTDKAAVFPE